jgi:hypothetical protein
VIRQQAALDAAMSAFEEIEPACAIIVAAQRSAFVDEAVAKITESGALTFGDCLGPVPAARGDEMTEQTIKHPAIRYHGGKFRLASWIISHFLNTAATWSHSAAARQCF